MADHLTDGAVGEAVAALALVDHHVHQALGGGLSREGFEEQISESDRGAPAGTTQFDSQVGFAIRRWCAPVRRSARCSSPPTRPARPNCTTWARCCGAGPPPPCLAAGPTPATGAPP